jgi:hypothetical protein
VGVWGSPGFQNEPDQLADLLATCQQLRRWAGVHGVELDASPESLSALDEALDRIPNRQRDRALANDAGCYLGTILVRHHDQARWQIWPNGHPVVRMPSGRDLDVVAIVSDAAQGGTPQLAKHYADATGDQPA